LSVDGIVGKAQAIRFHKIIGGDDNLKLLKGGSGEGRFVVEYLNTFLEMNLHLVAVKQ
jgi:hypothetical protein